MKKKKIVTQSAGQYPTINVAVYTAIKSFPYLYSINNTARCLLSKPRRTIIIDSNGLKISFSYRQGANYSDTIHTEGKALAFKAAMHFFVKVKELDNSQILLKRTSDNTFAVFVNRFALLRCTYSNNDIPESYLPIIEMNVCNGQTPETEEEYTACQYAIATIKKLNETSIPPIVKQYSKCSTMSHSEIINLSIPKKRKRTLGEVAKRSLTVSEPIQTKKANATNKRMRKRSHAAQRVSSSTSLWSKNWVDRYDHDD
jgi:hypothetical protein